MALGCDEPKDNPIQKGQDYVNQARGIAAGDFDEKINLARSFVENGKLTEAQTILDQLGANEAGLTTEKRLKLDEVRRELDNARRQ